MRCVRSLAYACGEYIYLPHTRCYMPSFAWPSGLTRPATSGDGWPVTTVTYTTAGYRTGHQPNPDPPRSAPRPRPPPTPGAWCRGCVGCSEAVTRYVFTFKAVSRGRMVLSMLPRISLGKPQSVDRNRTGPRLTWTHRQRQRYPLLQLLPTPNSRPPTPSHRPNRTCPVRPAAPRSLAPLLTAPTAPSPAFRTVVVRPLCTGRRLHIPCSW